MPAQISNQKSEIQNWILLTLRHAFNVLAGFLIAHGIHADATNAGSILAGLIVLGLVCLVSWLSKLKWAAPFAKEMLSESGRAAMQKAAAVLASNGLAALSGYLATTPDGAALDVQNPEALVLFFINAAASRYKLHHSLLGVPKASLALALLLTLPACSTASRDTLKHDLTALLASAAQETSREALKLTLAALESEADALEAAPIETDWQKQLITQSRLLTLRAAISTAKQRLAAMSGAKAVIEVNPVNPVTINPSRGGSNGTSQSMPPHARPVKVIRESAAPLLHTTRRERRPSKEQGLTSHLSAGRPASGPPSSTAHALRLPAMRRPAVPLYAPRIVAALRSAS